MSDPHHTGDALNEPTLSERDRHAPPDRFVILVSNFVAWLFPALMIVICAQVFLRSFGRIGFGPGNQAWMDDLQWWMYGMAVLVGLAYAVTTNSHVRVDIFYDHFSQKKMARTDVFALAWLFLPFVMLCLDMSMHYAFASIAANEGSDSPNGLHRLWLLKTGMCICFFLMFVAGWAAYVRRLRVLTAPVFWKQMLFAFPATMYAINLAVFYSIWWFIKLTGQNPETGETLSNRQVSRHTFFDPIELGTQEMPKTVAITVLLTPVLILMARTLARGSRS